MTHFQAGTEIPDDPNPSACVAGVITGPDPSRMSLAEYALAVLDYDVSPHTPKQDGSKLPQAVPMVDVNGEPVPKLDDDGQPVLMANGKPKQAWGWKHRQTIRPTAEEIRRQFSKPSVTGFGVVTGVVSGPLAPLPDGYEGPPAPLSLEMLEWEEAWRLDECRETAYAIGLGELFDRVTDGYLSATPGGGLHTFIRSTVIEGNQKLAQRPATAEELKAKPHKKLWVTIETRGQGGWTVEPPSHGKVHPTGEPYRLLRGGFSTIATVTVEERERLFELLRTFNEVHEEQPASEQRAADAVPRFNPATNGTRNGYDGPSGLDVIREYNAQTTWESLLLPLEWKPLHQRGNTTYWQRPGKDGDGTSATTNYGGADRFCVFSTSTPYETVGDGRKAAMSKFALYAAEYHGGDNKAAIRVAADMLGMRRKRRPGPTVHGEFFSPRDPQDATASPGEDQPSDTENDAADVAADAESVNDTGAEAGADEVEDAVKLLHDLEERVRADHGVPFQPETLGALALLQERAPAEWARHRETLRKAKVSLRDLEKALKRKRIRRSGFRVVDDSEAAEQPSRMAASMVPDAPAPTLIIPQPYFLRADATCVVRQRTDPLTGAIERSEVVIAHAPIIITGRLRDDAEGVEALRLSWRRKTLWVSKTVNRSVAMNAQLLVATSDEGAPVTSSNAKDIVPYLDALEAANYAQLPCARISGHLGWQGDRGAGRFLVGRHLLLPSGEMCVGLNLAEMAPEDWREDYVSFRGAASGDEQIADAYQARGTIDGWRRAVSVLAGHPRALLPFYVPFAAPLLEILGAPNFIVDISNRTSTGKTTAARAGASVWGNPDERTADSVIGSWDATKVWIERASAVLHGLPLFLDDTKRAKDSRTIADTMYAVANGRGRGRGNPRGLARTRAWRTVLISTGEAPATSFTQDGGTRTRVLSIRGTPFGVPTDDTRRMVDQLNLGVLTNYGHAGPIFVRWLMQRRSEWDKLTEMYQLLVERFASEARNAEGGRLAQYAAVISLTARLAHEALELPWRYDDPLEELWAELATEAEDAAGDLRALRDVMSWAHSRESTFWGRAPYDRDGNSRVPLTGWSGRWDHEEAWEYLGLFPTVLDKVLKDLGYEPAAILAGWAERGWFQTDGDRGRHQKRVRVGGEVARLYAISRAAMVEADA